MSQAVTIKDLIVAAAEGASEGVDVLTGANIPVELDEFSIKVTYASTTEVTTKSAGSLGGSVLLKFIPIRAKIGHTRSTRREVTYGLEVKFIFSGKEKADTP